MFEKSYIHHAYYVGNEIKYGCYLYYTGWKKLLLHPIQTVQDTAYAIYHPIQTGKILLNQVKEHPIGVAVNLSLSWSTGYFVSTGMEYVEHLIPEIDIPVDLSSMLLMQNSTKMSDASISSTVSQVAQIGSQAMSGGCCGGVCTMGRIGQTTSVITSQSASSAENRDKLLPSASRPVVDKKDTSFLTSFWKVSAKDNKACKDTSCKATNTCSEDTTALRKMILN